MNNPTQSPKRATITLLDGRELPVILRLEQPTEVQPDEQALDTTGQYFSMGKALRRSSKEVSLLCGGHSCKSIRT